MNEWCEHTKIHRESKDIDGDWVFVNHIGCSANSWKFCPICGKPRPAEKKKLWEALSHIVPDTDDYKIAKRMAETAQTHIIEGLPSVYEAYKYACEASMIDTGGIKYETLVGKALELIKESIRKA